MQESFSTHAKLVTL